ncbi:hypothetical protein BOTNAR_0010g00330 [Botryotinia narcissicola]|uniref:Uncharacterized protein n=1 Tax=Botryotinia narcissicola TaxID=278944 RepID=A0A4Z1J7C7_9HELO|nr:hypothetical protein BOTNAR_0010g00330 [Botryotinia narcissicola]
MHPLSDFEKLSTSQNDGYTSLPPLPAPVTGIPAPPATIGLPPPNHPPIPPPTTGLPGLTPGGGPAPPTTGLPAPPTPTTGLPLPAPPIIGLPIPGGGRGGRGELVEFDSDIELEE